MNKIITKERKKKKKENTDTTENAIQKSVLLLAERYNPIAF